MTINVQLLRGDTAKVGNVLLKPGSLAMDVERFELRLHDGITVGGHVIPNKTIIPDLQSQLDSLDINDVDGLTLALAAKAGLDLLGTADGIATLDGNGTIPAEQLPSFVNDIIEASTMADLPAVGELDKLYVVVEDELVHRWNGSAYVAISPTIETTDDLTEGLVSLYYTDQRVKDTLSAQGDVSYDAATGVFDFSESINEVQGQLGDVSIDKVHVELEDVENYRVARDELPFTQSREDNYVTPISMRYDLMHVGVIEEEMAWYVDGGFLKSATGPGPSAFATGDLGTGFYGEVTEEELISGETLAILNDYTYGSKINHPEGEQAWLKYSLDDKTLFVAKKPFRRGVSWNTLQDKGMVDGDNLIIIKDEVFRTRLLSATPNEDNVITYYGNGPNHPETANSEFNRLVGNSVVGPFKYSGTNYDYDNMVVNGSLASYSEDDLYFRSENGFGYQTITRTMDSGGQPITIGGNGPTYLTRIPTGSGSNNYGWRPVLEHVSPDRELIPPIDSELVTGTALVITSPGDVSTATDEGVVGVTVNTLEKPSVESELQSPSVQSVNSYNPMAFEVVTSTSAVVNVADITGGDEVHYNYDEPALRMGGFEVEEDRVVLEPFLSAAQVNYVDVESMVDGVYLYDEPVIYVGEFTVEEKGRVTDPFVAVTQVNVVNVESMVDGVYLYDEPVIYVGEFTVEEKGRVTDPFVAVTQVNVVNVESADDPVYVYDEPVIYVGEFTVVEEGGGVADPFVAVTQVNMADVESADDLVYLYDDPIVKVGAPTLTRTKDILEPFIVSLNYNETSVESADDLVYLYDDPIVKVGGATTLGVAHITEPYLTSTFNL